MNIRGRARTLRFLDHLRRAGLAGYDDAVNLGRVTGTVRRVDHVTHRTADFVEGSPIDTRLVLDDWW